MKPAPLLISLLALIGTLGMQAHGSNLQILTHTSNPIDFLKVSTPMTLVVFQV